jgi:hypothetical protein
LKIAALSSSIKVAARLSVPEPASITAPSATEPPPS